MKVTITSFVLLFMLAAFTTNLTAQQRAQNPDRMRAQMQEQIQQNRQGMGNHHMQLMARLDLNEDQKNQIQEWHLAQQKIMMTQRASIKEKRARLQNLRIADNYSESAVNTVIDEISELQATMMKQRASHQQKIREILTDEQRIKFDLFHQNAGKMMRHKIKNK